MRWFDKVQSAQATGDRPVWAAGGLARWQPHALVLGESAGLTVSAFWPVPSMSRGVGDTQTLEVVLRGHCLTKGP